MLCSLYVILFFVFMLFINLMAFSRIFNVIIIISVGGSGCSINIILQTMEFPSMTLSLTYSQAIPLISPRLLPL